MHDIRHSWISAQFEAGTPAHAIMEAAAHRSLSVTSLYAHGTDEARRAAADRVSVAVELPPAHDTPRDTRLKRARTEEPENVLPRDGIEPPTRGFSIRLSEARIARTERVIELLRAGAVTDAVPDDVPVRPEARTRR
jgi:hypothetical protein